MHGSHTHPLLCLELLALQGLVHAFRSRGQEAVLGQLASKVLILQEVAVPVEHTVIQVLLVRGKLGKLVVKRVRVVCGHPVLLHRSNPGCLKAVGWVLFLRDNANHRLTETRTKENDCGSVD